MHRTGSYASFPQLTPDEALQRLIDGNNRFASNVRSVDSMVSHLRRAELVAGQRPFAVIVGCSDSRAPAEIVFDQGLGDLFVIRVAGPVIGASQIGSVEFACERFGVPLVMVLGHSQCGAIAATISEILQPDERASRHVLSIVNRIRPAVDELVLRHRHDPTPELFEVAVKANVRACMTQILEGSKLLDAKIAAGELKLVGAEYEIETGRIDFVDV